MMKKKIIALLIFIFSNIFYLQAQFGIPEEVCPAITLDFTSPNPSAFTHKWDFCTGDLLGIPTANTINEDIPGTNRPEGIDVVFDGTNWYGFIMNYDGNNIVRVDFGNDLNNSNPTFNNLGVIGGSSIYGQPTHIRIIRNQDGNWYGFINNLGFGGSSGASVVKLDFGSALDNTPTATLIRDGYFTPFSGVVSLEPVFDGVNYYVLVLNFTWDTVNGGFDNIKLSILDFGSTLDNTPSVTHHDFFETPVPIWRDLEVIKDGNNWYAFAVTSSNKFYRIDFGNSLNNTPTLVDISSVSSDTRILKLARDGQNIIAFFLEGNSDLYRLNFGTDITNLNPSISNLGDFDGQLGQDSPQGPTLCMDLVKEQSSWTLFAINRNIFVVGASNPDELVRVNFPEANCVAETVYSESVNPPNQYLASGNAVVSLETFDENFNLINYYVDDFLVKDETIGNFTAYNQCLGETTFFQNNSIGSDASVGSWEWDFGDGFSSTEKEPQHAYANSGIYDVKLKVTNLSGCINEVEKQIKIIQYPQTDFEINMPRCINQEITFTNISTVDPISSSDPNAFFTSYWDYGDVPPDAIAPSGLNDGKYTYTTAGIYPVTLSVNDFYNVIPPLACSGTTTKNVTVGEFPIADFSNTLACVNAPTNFTDLSTIAGAAGNQIIEWSWDFAGLGNSNLQNPNFTFENAGSYNITLTVKSICDCEHSFTKEIEVLPSIESLFASSIVQGAAPLTVEFVNQSIGADSYFWDFGDSNTSTEESPSYTFDAPGTYVVSFQAKNSLGCGSLATETITVLDPGTDISLNDLNATDNNGIVEISVEIKNENTSTISEILLDLDLGNIESIQETWTGTLLAEESTTYTFQKVLSSGELNDLQYICAEGVVQNISEDINPLNNISCYIISEEFEFLNLSPNPADTDFIFEYYLPDTNVDLSLDIIDDLGKIVSNQKITDTRNGVNRHSFNITNLTNGVYIIRLSYGGVSKTKKLLIVK